MTDDKMIRMANQIATFFDSQPDDNAAEEIANHLKLFWDPRMRAQLARYLAAGGAGLAPSVIAAGARL